VQERVFMWSILHIQHLRVTGLKKKSFII